MDQLGRRNRLHVLDSCLEVLEAAQAQGQRTLPDSLCERLQQHVSGVTPDLSITEAMELVFREQEHHLVEPSRGRASEVSANLDSEMPTLALAERPARLLTETIKKRLHGDVSLLLFRAHNERAWAALGYRSWEVYVWREFGLSRRRSYELLDHARVITSIRVAAGMSGIPKIRPYTAMQLKSHLERICDTLRDKTSDLAPTEVESVVDELLREWKSQHVSERAFNRTLRSSPASSLSEGGSSRTVQTEDRASAAGADLGRLEEAIAYLANLPPLTDEAVWRLRVSERMCYRDLPKALQQLTNLANLVAAAEWSVGAAS